MSNPSMAACFLTGTSRQPTSAVNTTPEAATARPTGVKSNMVKLPMPFCARKPETIRLGGVPTMVVMPPRMDAKARGMRTRPGGNSRRAATCSAMGMSSARAPTLFMKPESTAAMPASAATVRVRPADDGTMRRTRASTAPEFSSPLLSTRTQATVITAGCPNPRNASRDGTSPASTQASRAPAATMSCRQRPQRNIATVAARMPRMRSCSVVSARLRPLAKPLQGLSPSLPPGRRSGCRPAAPGCARPAEDRGSPRPAPGIFGRSHSRAGS